MKEKMIMPDVVHRVELGLSGFVCPDCDIELPDEVASYGDDVVELGGASIHWIPKMAHDGPVKSCKKITAKNSVSVIVCIECDGAGCDACNSGVLASDGSTVLFSAAQPEAGETVEYIPPKTDFEKMTTRMSVQNFVNLKEMTKPDESS